MKLVIAFLVGGSLTLLLFYIQMALSQSKKPSKDSLSLALEKFVEQHLLNKNYPYITAYAAWVERTLKEPPVAKLNVKLLLACQLFGGILLWIVFSIGLGSFSVGLGLLLVPTGLALPYFYVRHKLSQHHVVLMKALPDCFDLIALMMEAGLDFGSALQQYIAKGTSGPLRDLWEGAQQEIQMGCSRMEALERMIERTTFPTLRTGIRNIIQSLTLGTSLAPMLRAQAVALRTKRMQIAEKKAAEAPLKVLFPLFVFIFPTVFLILFGPMALLFMKGGF